MKIIEIIVSPQGETKIETRGFSGSECQQASQFIELALGTKTSELVTPEFHQAHSSGENQQQTNG